MGLAGGVVGGIVVVLISLWLQSGGSDELAALQGKIEQIEGSVASSSSDQTNLKDRVDALEQSTSAPAASDSGDVVARVEALETKAEAQDTMQARLEALESGGGSAPDVSGRLGEIEAALAELPEQNPQLSALEQRIAALEGGAAASGQASTSTSSSGSDDTSSATPVAGADEQAIKALQDRLAALEQRLPETGQQQDTEAQLAKIDQRLSAAEQAGGKLEERLTVSEQTGTQLDQRLSAAEQAGGQLTQLSDTITKLSAAQTEEQKQSADLSTKLSALDQRVGEAETQIKTADLRRSRAAALALIVGQLEAAIQASQPYESQVKTLSAMTAEEGPGDDAIKQAVSELEPGATSGVASVATLRQAFVPVANEVVHAAQAPEGNNLISRATDNLMRLVTVRPVGGDVRGDGVAARVARAEAGLDKGDLAGAVSELDQLDGRPADAAAAWLKEAKARLGADQAVTQLRTQATDLLTQSN